MNFIIDDTSYEVIVERKNNKNLYIRVTEDIKIKVTCPYLYTNKYILKILENNKKSVYKMIEKQVKRSLKGKKEDNFLLGKAINILYKDVKKADFEDNLLTVKDDNMKEKWFKNKAKEVFKVHLDNIYMLFEENIPYPKLKVRSMKTRWGVCNKRDDSVTLNLELIKKEEKYLNYVIVHELSHFLHFNHSKAFWQVVEKYCPEYKIIRKELKE